MFYNVNIRVAEKRNFEVDVLLKNRLFDIKMFFFLLKQWTYLLFAYLYLFNKKRVGEYVYSTCDYFFVEMMYLIAWKIFWKTIFSSEICKTVPKNFQTVHKSGNIYQKRCWVASYTAYNLKIMFEQKSNLTLFKFCFSEY